MAILAQLVFAVIVCQPCSDVKSKTFKFPLAGSTVLVDLTAAPICPFSSSLAQPGRTHTVTVVSTLAIIIMAAATAAHLVRVESEPSSARTTGSASRARPQLELPRRPQAPSHGHC
eukprot:1678099-Rhodomonas_salina.1